MLSEGDRLGVTFKVSGQHHARPRKRGRTGLLRPGMCLVVYRDNMLHRELSVALRRGEALVTEQFLDGSQVGSLLQHVSTEGVT